MEKPHGASLGTAWLWQALFNIKIEKGERRPSSWGRAVSFFALSSVSTGFGGKLCGKYGKLSRSGVLMGLPPCYPRSGELATDRM